MPTIAAGASGSYTISSTQSITITLDPNERAIVSVLRSGQQVFGDRLSGSKTIGPFFNGDVMTITAYGAAVDYTAATTPPSAGQIIISSSAPVDADGRADGTIWIQTA